MSHLAPHRLAALASGKLAGRAAARARRHLDDCPACRTAWERVKAARATFPDLAALPAPELRWDKIRAQTYWTLGADRGSARHPALDDRAPLPAATARAWRWSRIVPAGVLAAAAAGAVIAWQLGPDRALPRAAPIAIAAPEAAAPRAPAPLTAVITLVEAGGAITTADGRAIAGGNAVGAHPLGAGDRITTGDGRLAAQFGPGSTLTLAPHSTLVVARFDDAAIELQLGDAGAVSVEVATRAPGQRFAVRAGDRTVEVRGTAFRVERAGDAVAVACEHGRVAVSSAGGTIELGAGQALALPDGEPLLGRAARPMTDVELAALLAARPAALPQWTDPDTIFRTTTGLALAAPTDHLVSIDGVPIGRGPLWRRVPPGRHLVESTDGAGRVHPGRWVEVDAASADRPVVLAAAPAEAAPAGPDPALAATGTAAARKRRITELHRATDQEQLRNCVRALAKQGLAAGTHVELEIGVQASGAIRYLNILDTDLPSRTAACVRDVVGAARLGSGAQVSWRHRVTF